MVTSELLIVISLLREASGKFNDLEKEARINVEKRDTVSYREKLNARAQLLIDLEVLIAVPVSALKETEKDLGFEIRAQVAAFARQAREALSSTGTFLLSALLTNQGDMKGDKNDLEKLIKHLESK